MVASAGACASVRRLLPPNATKHSPGLVVAVKRLKPEVLQEPNDLKDFLMEVNVMRKLKHACVGPPASPPCRTDARATCQRSALRSVLLPRAMGCTSPLPLVAARSNIVAIHGIGASDLSGLEAMRSSMYVVMEAMSGGNLKLCVLRQMMTSK